MPYLKIVVIFLFIEACLLIGCMIARRKYRNSVDVDKQNQIENVTTLIIWFSVFFLVILMTGVLLKIT